MSANTQPKPDTPMSENSDKKEEIDFGVIDDFCGRMQDMEKFIARRFDEISMEINATSQQFDMAEESITKRFAEILDVLQAVSFSGDGKTPANAGVELDAVVDMTEKAANRILDAAERISSQIHTKDLSKESDRNIAIPAIEADIGEILMACSFQDITGQRIRTTLENLKTIEGRLTGALEKIGVDVEPMREKAKAEAMTQSGVTQDDIDGMFGSANQNANETASQEDIDGMFD